MLKRECQKCGRQIDAEAARREGLIFEVELRRPSGETREWVKPTAPDVADLCVLCYAELRAAYFGIDREPVSREIRDALALAGPPAAPTFLEGPREERTGFAMFDVEEPGS